MRFFILCLLTMTPLLMAAEDNQDKPAAPEPPDLPAPVEDGETMDPEVTIIRKGEKTIQEYRVNGELYMVKVVPKIGRPYYLIDSNGDGNMDIQRSQLERNMKVPQWVLYSW